MAALGRAIAAQRGHLLNWVPVCLGVGIGAYFSIPFEPPVAWLWWAAVSCIVAATVTRRLPEDARPPAGALVLVVIGYLLAAAQAHRAAAPVLGWRFYGPVEGRIVAVDRSASDAVRLTLDRVWLARVPPDRTPERVRVSLHGTQGAIDPEPGLRVAMTAYLSPPSGPVEPGGFDFQRHAWFLRLGAVGYTRAPVLQARPPPRGMWLARARSRIADAVRARLGGQVGAFAAAVMTGDRSAIERGTVDDLRAANLAHLLAISGLHMGLVTGFVFAAVRHGLALWPWLALRVPVHKIAALAALAAGTVYLALAGGNVATERAFIMVAVAFGALLAGRRALTLRAVAVAATLVLLLHPASLPGPGFQMSFAATTALVAVFGAMRGRTARLPRWARPVLAVVVSSAVAGVATAPFAAAHFNRIASYGLLANVLSVPLMGLVVMPGAVIAAVLSPFGLGDIGLAMMAPAIRWILGVAHWVAGIEGAVRPVIAPPGAVLPMITLGALWALLWQGRRTVRAAGVLVAALAFALWAGASRPVALIADSGGLIGVMGPEGRALSKPRGDGFVARVWLENDGDLATQQEAASRAGLTGRGGAEIASLVVPRIVQLRGRGAAGRVAEACASGAAIVVLTGKTDAETGPGNRRCRVFDRRALERDGSVAVIARGEGWQVVTARSVTGERLWNSTTARPRQ